jgi:hypothetical protein
MTWNNHGEWHIHHIKEIHIFKFINTDGSINYEAIKECNSFSNLCPLWANDHLKIQHGSKKEEYIEAKRKQSGTQNS